MSAKDYIRLVPRKVMLNARSTPRVCRPWRTRSLSRLTTFYRNRFYEIDRWYKARIPHIPEYPVCYNIVPEVIQKSLMERLQEFENEDPVLREKVNIGLHYSPCSTSALTQQQAFLAELRKDTDLERRARNCEVDLDLQAVDADDYSSSQMPEVICQIAKHLGIFRDLFHRDAYFYPVVPLTVSYPLCSSEDNEGQSEISDGDSMLPVHFGNTIYPVQAQTAPVVNFPKVASGDELWTLLMVNADGNVFEQGKDVCHWLVSNILNSDLSSGDTICTYLPPLPLRGTGYHRITFILFKQDTAEPLDLARFSSVDKNYESRTFSTAEFYKQHEDVLTPAGLAFFQTQWDVSCTNCFQNMLNITEPSYERIPDSVDLPDQIEFPKKQSFDKYMDKYRDVYDMEKEVLQKRLANTSPFKSDEPRYPYPNIFKTLEERETMSTWQRDRREKERLGLGRFSGLYENRLE